MKSSLLDGVLRGALAAPGLLVDLVDGRAMPEHDTDPGQVYPLVRATARHPEAHLALEPGLHYHVHGGYVQAFEVRRRTAFAIGGLNVPPEQQVAFLAGFRHALVARGLSRQMIFPLRATDLSAAGEAGFRALQVGVEAWIDLPEATLRGKRWAHVRQMRNRARRRGVAVEEAPVERWRDEMTAVHAAWLDAKRPSWRMKLLVGSPGLERPFDRRYLVAHTEDRLEAFLTLLPGAEGEWGVDVMCRRPDAVPGAMERLLVHAMERLRDEGATALSLGPCPMAGVPVEGDRRLLKALFGLLYRSWWGNQVFGFRSLYRFKRKFRPRWEPVYFAASPRLGPVALYRGCRMWGLY
jgi:lysylphosphatidylglycerol synthetase-like protein (DUF2156 family)